MQRPSSFISRMRKYRSDDPFSRVLPFSSSTFTVASVMNSKFRTCNSTGRFSPILSLYRSHGVHFSVKCPAECRGNKEAPSRHAPSVSPHVAVLSRRLHEGQWERRLCNQSSMLFRRQLSQSWRGWMRVHEKGRESRATSSHPVNHSHPPPTHPFGRPPGCLSKKMGVVAVVTRTAACSANKGRYVGASSSQTALTPKHNSSCPWRQHRLASEHTPDKTARVKQKKSTGTSATYATSFWLAQLVASSEEEGAPHPQITVPKLAALQPCSPTVAR